MTTAACPHLRCVLTPLLVVDGCRLSRVRCQVCNVAWWTLGSEVIDDEYALGLMKLRVTTIEHVPGPPLLPPRSQLAPPVASTEWFTTADVAKLCGVTERTILNWVANGRLRANRPGGRLRFARNDVEVLLDGK
jgi:excisionase family DNA binding protein